MTISRHQSAGASADSTYDRVMRLALCLVLVAAACDPGGSYHVPGGIS